MQKNKPTTYQFLSIHNVVQLLKYGALLGSADSGEGDFESDINRLVSIDLL